MSTNPMWYLPAISLTPRDLGSTARQHWVEGFVAGAEWNDASPNLPTAEALGKFMFTRQAADYEGDPEVIANVWEDAAVKTFWTEEARAVLMHLEEGIGAPHDELPEHPVG